MRNLAIWCVGHVGDVTAVEFDPAGARARLAEDRHHQRRLTGPVGADQRHDLAGVDIEIDALQRLDLPIGRAQRPDGEQGCGSCGHDSTSQPSWPGLSRPSTLLWPSCM
jgi:hypothetical protein